MDALAAELKWTNGTIQHIHYDFANKWVVGDEHRVTGTQMHVDGFVQDATLRAALWKHVGWERHDAKRLLALEFLGDLYHGHPAVDRSTKTHLGGKTYGELYDETMARFKRLHALGYDIVYIWERDFRAWKKDKTGQLTSKLQLYRPSPDSAAEMEIDSSS
jgi:hypothetical protein